MSDEDFGYREAFAYFLEEKYDLQYDVYLTYLLGEQMVLKQAFEDYLGLQEVLRAIARRKIR